MLKKEDLDCDYSSLLKSIQKCVEIKEFEKALKLIELLSKIAYQYNFKTTFSDLNVEELIVKIFEANFQVISINGLENKVLFYDYFGYDNRGLTQQYLRALMLLGKEIVYILEQPNNLYSSSEILTELKGYSKASIYILGSSKRLDKVREILGIIKEEKPLQAFLHLAPWDVVACTAFLAVQGITRFQINLTDHAFWLGVGITDINLEFRSFGFNLSIQKRGLDESKVKILPFYPIVTPYPFEGLPPQVEGKKIIFSGGAIYKILGENLIFLRLIKELLSISDELVFIFGGSGNTTTIKQFIRENQLEDRFFLLGDRKDIYKVLQRVDFYLTTFPFTGALMSQIAAASLIPIFFFSPPEFQCNDLNDMFFKSSSLETFTELNSLILRFKEIYEDKRFLKGYASNLQNGMITPEEFANGLNEIIKGNRPFEFLEQKFDVNIHQNVFSNYLLESENLYNPQYKNIVLSFLKTAYERKTFMPRFYIKEQRINWNTDKMRYFKNCFRVIFPKWKEIQNE